MIEFAKTFVGAIIEGSNRADFADSHLLQIIDETPSSSFTNIVLQKPVKYRYIRIRKPQGGISIAEFAVYDCNNKRIDGDIIASNFINGQAHIDVITDNNPLTYFDITGNFYNTWIGLDLGKIREIGKILFCPRTDDNDICVGDEYELFYWDKEWISLGTQIATDNSLTFTNAPSKALYYLKDLSKGVEERPFTYENGKQIWW